MRDSEIVGRIRDRLKSSADPKTRDSAQNFFKEEIKAHGVKTAIVTRISKETYKEIAGQGKARIFELGEELLKSGYIEEAIVAFKWADYVKAYAPADFPVLERWLQHYVSNWATCDTLCNHAIGSFMMQYPDYVAHLKAWTHSDNRWMRRGAAVTLVLPARKGLFLDDVLEIATSLLHDEDDLVQKGYGWMLKEASKQHETQVFDFVVQNKATMPRTALRYAIERMPEDLRKEAMRK